MDKEKIIKDLMEGDMFVEVLPHLPNLNPHSYDVAELLVNYAFMRVVTYYKKNKTSMSIVEALMDTRKLIKTMTPKISEFLSAFDDKTFVKKVLKGVERAEGNICGYIMDFVVCRYSNSSVVDAMDAYLVSGEYIPEIEVIVSSNIREVMHCEYDHVPGNDLDWSDIDELYINTAIDAINDTL